MPESSAISPAFREQLRCQLLPALELVSAALQPDNAVACKLLLAARAQLKALSAVSSVEQRPGVLPFTRVRRRQLCEQACDELIASARAYFEANDPLLDMANSMLLWLGGRPIYGRLPVDDDVCAGRDPADWPDWQIVLQQRLELVRDCVRAHLRLLRTQSAALQALCG